MSPTPRDLSTLRDKLGRGRARLRLQGLVAALAWGLVAVGGVYLGLHLAVRVGYGPDRVWLWPLLLAVFAAVFAALGIRALLRVPSLAEVARRADRRFGLFESCSTALELADASPGAEPTPLIGALFADAEWRAAAIDPRVLAPLRLPRPLWVAGLLMGASGLLQWGGLPNAAQAGGEAAPLTKDVRSSAVTQLRETAALLADEAAAQQDPYLQALAQAFGDLGERVETGDLSGAEAGAELERLMGHWGRSYGEAPRAEPSLVSRSESQVTPPAQSPPSFGELLEGLSEVGADLRTAKAEREAGRGRVRMDELTDFNPYTDPNALTAQARFESSEDTPALVGQAIGAARSSGAGAGDLAGQGSQAIAETGGTDAFAGLETEADDVLLPEGRGDSGEQLRLEIAPETRYREVADATEAEPAPWQASKEAEMRRDRLLPRDRQGVAGYFKPPDDTSP